MSFTQATENYFAKWSDFGSRISRSEYWWGLVGSQLIMYLSFPIIIFWGFYTLTIAFFALFLFIFISQMSLTARRLHDINMSGWWQLALPIPFLGLLLWLYWTLKQGDEGENRFGPDPQQH